MLTLLFFGQVLFQYHCVIVVSLKYLNPSFLNFKGIISNSNIYVFFCIVNKQYVFVCSPLVNKLLPDAFPNSSYHLILTEGKDDKKEGMLNYM